MYHSYGYISHSVNLAIQSDRGEPMAIPVSERNINAGCLSDVQRYGPDGGLYFLLDGEMPDVPFRMQCMTRGKERERAATRVPFRIRGLEPPDAREAIAAISEPTFWSVVQALVDVDDDLPGGCNVDIPLVRMPRAGSKLTGYEWNAPGGTAEVGESFYEVGNREEFEESDMLALGFHYKPWGPAMSASGAFDEIQLVSGSVVIGEPTRLAEGAIEWKTLPLFDAVRWMNRQNRLYFEEGLLEDPEGGEPVHPVDLKVISLVYAFSRDLDGFNEFGGSYFRED